MNVQPLDSTEPSPLVRSWLGLVLLASPLAWAVYYHLAIGRPGWAARRSCTSRGSHTSSSRSSPSPLSRSRGWPSITTARWATAGLTALLAAALVGQLPATARVVSEPDAADWAAAAMITALLDDAIVIYDVVPIGMFRQAFHARPRYLAGSQRVMGARAVMRRAPAQRRDAPLHVLLLTPDPGSDAAATRPHRSPSHPMDGGFVCDSTASGCTSRQRDRVG